MNLAIIGAQWGDEGKGKLVDLLAEHFDIVTRYQGGHTVNIREGGRKDDVDHKFVLRERFGLNVARVYAPKNLERDAYSCESRAVSDDAARAG